MFPSMHRRLAVVLLSVFALVGQLLLPSMHAQQWAQRAGNPLLAAFCGETSPALAASLAKTLPPELIKQFEGKARAAKAGQSCSLCLSLHAGALGAATLALPSFAHATSTLIRSVIPATPLTALVSLPQSRGPPSRF